MLLVNELRGLYTDPYLAQEDVLALVELTEDIKHDRRRRIREMQGEREFLKDGSSRRRIGGSNQEWDEEKIIEREIVYDNGSRRRY